jgi:hypothetical protein
MQTQEDKPVIPAILQNTLYQSYLFEAMRRGGVAARFENEQWVGDHLFESAKIYAATHGMILVPMGKHKDGSSYFWFGYPTPAPLQMPTEHSETRKNGASNPTTVYAHSSNGEMYVYVAGGRDLTSIMTSFGLSQKQEIEVRCQTVRTFYGITQSTIEDLSMSVQQLPNVTFQELSHLERMAMHYTRGGDLLGNDLGFVE